MDTSDSRSRSHAGASTCRAPTSSHDRAQACEAGRQAVSFAVHLGVEVCVAARAPRLLESIGMILRKQQFEVRRLHVVDGGDCFLDERLAFAAQRAHLAAEA